MRMPNRESLSVQGPSAGGRMSSLQVKADPLGQPGFVDGANSRPQAEEPGRPCHSSRWGPREGTAARGSASALAGSAAPLPGIADYRSQEEPTHTKSRNFQPRGLRGQISRGLYHITSGQIKQSPRSRSSWPAPARGHTPAPTPGLNPSPQSSHKPSCLRLSAQGFHSSSRTLVSPPDPARGAPSSSRAPHGGDLAREGPPRAKYAVTCGSRPATRGRETKLGQGPLHQPPLSPLMYQRRGGPRLVQQKGLWPMSRAPFHNSPGRQADSCAHPSLRLKNSTWETHRRSHGQGPSGAVCSRPTSSRAAAPNCPPQRSTYASATSPLPASLPLQACNLPQAQDQFSGYRHLAALSRNLALTCLFTCLLSAFEAYVLSPQRQGPAGCPAGPDQPVPPHTPLAE